MVVNRSGSLGSRVTSTCSTTRDESQLLALDVRDQGQPKVDKLKPHHSVAENRVVVFYHWTVFGFNSQTWLPQLHHDPESMATAARSGLRLFSGTATHG